ncbi:MAG: DMT family transporter [Candidatus Marinimicrobia bacterium]|nr:DMT family transporter [Candidatus Neomarinimicrobiota bacterium]
MQGVNPLWLVVALLSVSSSSIIVRFLPDVSAIVIAFWRMGLASLFLWGYSGLKNQGKLKSTWRIPVIIAGIFLGFHFAFFFSAVKLTKISNATLLGTTAPLFTLFIEMVFMKRKFPALTIIAILLSVFGVLVVQGFSLDFKGDESVGNLSAVACSVCLAFVMLIAEKIRKDTSTVLYLRHLFMIAAITLFTLSMFSGDFIFDFSGSDFLWFVALSVFPSILGHGILNYSVKFLPPSVVSSVSLGETIIASTAAYFIFMEPVPFNTVIGGIMTLTGLFILGIRNQEARFSSDTG